MIYEVDGVFVISSGGCWLPGSYETKEAARYAFQFSNEELHSLQQEKSPNCIAMQDLRDLREKRPSVPYI